MMLDDGDTHSTGADDDHDDYKAEDTEDDRDDGMSVDSSEPGTLEVVLKYNKAGPVSNYLTTSKNKTENLTTNPAKEVDTVMKDIESEAPANENGQNTPQNGTDVQPDSIPIAAKVNGLNRETKSGYLQQLPVGTGAPPNGTTVAEIRSKGPEVG